MFIENTEVLKIPEGLKEQCVNGNDWIVYNTIQIY